MKLQNKLQYKKKYSSKFDELEYYIALFDDFLKNQKQLSKKYCYYICKVAKQFLIDRFGSKKIRLYQLKSNDITDFFYQYSHHLSPYSIRNMASGLRSFLRFLKFKGMITLDLDTVIPHVAVWQKDRIPSFLSSQEVRTLLKQCDRSTSIGLRNYTILCLILNLGLRASEVVNLTLDDLDWANGEIVVKGKGSRIDRLPLEQGLGKILVAYLCNARPRCSSRYFFISAIKPFHGLQSHQISMIVGRILKQAGLKKKGKAAHLLRHTLATRLLNKGASLQEIGGILRHQSIDTTAIYAKVDFNRLRSLALPWPKNLYFGGAL